MTSFLDASSSRWPWGRLIAIVGIVGIAVLIYFAIPRTPQAEGGFFGQLPALLVPAPTFTLPVTSTPVVTPTPPSPPTGTAPPGTPTPQTVADGPPQARITGNVWCRSGPGIAYTAMAALVPGDLVRLTGQYQGDRGAYWVVETDQGTACWVPRRYATPLEGERAEAVPTVNPPPPPPVAFDIQIERLSECGDRHGLTLRLTNWGTRLLESVDVKLQGPGMAYTYTLEQHKRNGFEWWMTCNAGGRLERLLPGEVGFVTVDTPGREIKQGPIFVTVRTCTENNLQGLCLERSLSLLPP